MQQPVKTLRRTMIASRPKSTSLKVLTENRKSSYLPCYTNDYRPKPLMKTQCIRAGTASGYRSNNPHPPMTFMVWRLPSIPPPKLQNNRSSSSQSPPPIPIDEILSDERLLSTYQENYKRIKEQPLPPKHLEYYQNNSVGKYSFQSTTRQAYQKPEVLKSLKGFTTRYACNKEVVFRAKGVLPTVNESSPHSVMGTSKTQYTSDFGKTGFNLPKINNIINMSEKGLKSHCHGVRENNKKANCMICFDSKNQWISDWPGPTTL